MAPRLYDPQPGLGRAVRKLRLERGLTQKQLAEVAGLTAVSISNIERGHSNTTLGTIRRLAKVLGGTAAELIELAERLED